MSLDSKILTIAIPTYNRAKLLSQCILSIVSQVEESFKHEIELFISDNCSPDNTAEIIQQYLSKNSFIEHSKNEVNLGADGNIALCFKKAKGKYVWIFSDDDLLYPGYLKLIVDFLKVNEVGNVFLGNQWYKGILQLPERLPEKLDYTLFQDPLTYVERVNYWVTFITGNIINKSLVARNENIERYMKTNLVQLSWVLPVVFAGANNVVINNSVIACLEENTGGYKLVEVFGEKFSWILNDLIKSKSITNKAKTIINNHLLQHFFPVFLKKKNEKHDTEKNIFKTMFRLFWSYKKFWLYTLPALLKRK